MRHRCKPYNYQHWIRPIGALLSSIALCSVNVLADPNDLVVDITKSDIESLLGINVTSVTRSAVSLGKTAAAVSVLTSEDIRRSGATSIPELLRYIPGVQVARIDANKWAVSIRGFNSRASNKLLVLIDGRSIYDELFTGVLWETKDVMLEDVDRIEVIRGPGATIWGANAVNGVINIVTKKASETTGSLIFAGGGTEEKAFAGVRQGVKVGEGQFLRLYGKGYKRDESYLSGGASDDADLGLTGFRYDGQLNKKDLLTFQGDFYQGSQNGVSELVPETDTSGGNALIRWTHDLADGAKTTLRFYSDHTEFRAPSLGEIRDTQDLNFEHHLAALDIHQITWGTHYRFTTDEVSDTPLVGVEPDKRSDNTFSGFLQDEIHLLPNELDVTIGSKIEHNDYSGTELQPGIRGAYFFNEETSIWSAISRAVRVPSRLEQDLIANIPDVGTFQNTKPLDAEELVAYETGVRFSPFNQLLVDTAFFYNDYDSLFSVEGRSVGNKQKGEGYGAEVVTTYFPSENWRISTGYSLLRMNLELEEDSLQDPASVKTVEGSNAQHQTFARAGVKLFKKLELDGGIRFVDNLPAQDVDSYVVADVRVGFQVTKNVELSVVGQNLFDNHHFEQGGSSASQVQSGVYGKVLFKFD